MNELSRSIEVEEFAYELCSMLNWKTLEDMHKIGLKTDKGKAVAIVNQCLENLSPEYSKRLKTRFEYLVSETTSLISL